MLKAACTEVRLAKFGYLLLIVDPLYRSRYLSVLVKHDVLRWHWLPLLSREQVLEYLLFDLVVKIQFFVLVVFETVV